MMNSQYIKKLKLPDSPGVYFFLKGKKILYIGRATSIRDRARSYFSFDLIKTRGRLIQDMVEKADKIKFQKTDSVLEAIILEANLIKKFQPYYNTEEKDDKSFNYVVITKEDFPVVKVVRGKLLNQQPTTNNRQPKKVFGPFTNSEALQEALKFIRRLFPYRDEKCSSHIFQRQSASSLRQSADRRPCFNYHLGLCPGTCIGKISKADYAKTIRYIIQIFEGKKKSTIRGLEREMRRLAKLQEFEKAALIRKKLFALNHIRDISFIKKDFTDCSDVLKNIRITKGLSEKAGSLYSSVLQNTRIEAYDVAHLSGSGARGVMVVFENGEPKKSDYRIFSIKTAKPGNDIAALEEILTRRIARDEWPTADVVVVDGGVAQLNTAKKIIFANLKWVKTQIFSVVKDGKHKPRAILGGKNFDEFEKTLIFKADLEAHRFAIKSHRKATRKSLTAN